VSVLRSRETLEDEERERLGPWAVKSADSLGRGFEESEHPYRTCFQRDRDRIVHSRAFRRLEYKTQVFVHHEGDHLRNRLTHTLEAAQITRTIARALRLNEELAEAVVLAHDLGHTPFGHAGERVLSELMKEHGDFDHNRQSLRIVDLLEERNPAFRGLNLSSETREGILKHGCDWAHPVPLPSLGAQPTLEAQVADHADEIAYTNHDLDDGLRSGLLALDALDDLALWREVRSATLARFPDANERIAHAKTISALIDHLVTDLIEASVARLEDLMPGSADSVRSHSGRLMGFHSETAEQLRDLKAFLYENLYHHPRVLERSDQAGPVIGDLFHHLRAHIDALPDHIRALCELDGEERAIADYVAGMTDRFALQEHQHLLEARSRR
jgi:dGTPase